MKIKAFVFLFIIFCFSFSIYAFASETEVYIDSAIIDNNGKITLKGRVKNPVENQQLVLLVENLSYTEKYQYDNERYMYINQTDANCNSIGSYEISFDLSYLDFDTKNVYMARLGGTSIDTPFEILILVTGQSSECIWGDVNLDGIITANDAAITLQYVLTRLDLLPSQITAMRVTQADIITADNAAHILYKALNSMYKFPVEQ